MIVKAFRPVGWVAAIGAAALGCYMLSLQVAAERADLAGLERRILRTRQDIRSLQTELGTRGRLQQLEQWNAEVLALSAPVAGQFLESNVSLARFDVQQPTLDDRAEIRMASAEPHPAPGVPAGRRQLRLATASTAGVPSGAPVERDVQPLIRRASLAVAAPPARAVAAPIRQRTEVAPPGARGSDDVAPQGQTTPATSRTGAVPVRTASAAAPRTAAESSRSPANRGRGALLDVATLRDLRDESRTERAGGTRN